MNLTKYRFCFPLNKYEHEHTHIVLIVAACRQELMKHFKWHMWLVTPERSSWDRRNPRLQPDQHFNQTQMYDSIE